MKFSLTSLLLFIFVLIQTQGFSQDDRTFWQKLFGKKGEQVDVQDPKNSTDSLAVLLNNHLGEETETPNIGLEDSEEIKGDTSISVKPLTSGQGSLTLHMNDNVTNWLDSAKTQDVIGFRIQVFMGDLTEARSIRAALLNAGERATLDYNSSDYFVRVGDFRNYISAEKKLNAIRDLYAGAYVVKDRIKLD